MCTDTVLAHAASWSFFNEDDIRDMLDDAKRKAALANRAAATTMDKLDAIKKELGTISVAPVDSDLTNNLADVNQSSEI